MSLYTTGDCWQYVIFLFKNNSTKCKNLNTSFFFRDEYEFCVESKDGRDTFGLNEILLECQIQLQDASGAPLPMKALVSTVNNSGLSW